MASMRAVLVAGALVVGLLGYGFSLALFVVALRHLGTARTGAYFSLAPFFGALTSIALLGEPLSGGLIAAGALMAAGAWLHLTERHEALSRDATLIWVAVSVSPTRAKPPSTWHAMPPRSRPRLPRAAWA